MKNHVLVTYFTIYNKSTFVQRGLIENLLSPFFVMGSQCENRVRYIIPQRNYLYFNTILKTYFTPTVWSLNISHVGLSWLMSIDMLLKNITMKYNVVQHKRHGHYIFVYKLNFYNNHVCPTYWHTNEVSLCTLLRPTCNTRGLKVGISYSTEHPESQLETSFGFIMGEIGRRLAKL